MHKNDVTQDKFKDVTYVKFVCYVCPTKAEPNRTRLNIGGYRINYPGDCGTTTVNALLVKILVKSMISTTGAKFMTVDINMFYPIHP